MLVSVGYERVVLSKCVWGTSVRCDYGVRVQVRVCGYGYKCGCGGVRVRVVYGWGYGCEWGVEYG